jgi:hypothetical protein
MKICLGVLQNSEHSGNFSLQVHTAIHFFILFAVVFCLVVCVCVCVCVCVVVVVVVVVVEATEQCKVSQALCLVYV